MTGRVEIDNETAGRVNKFKTFLSQPHARAGILPKQTGVANVAPQHVRGLFASRAGAPGPSLPAQCGIRGPSQSPGFRPDAALALAAGFLFAHLAATAAAAISFRRSGVKAAARAPARLFSPAAMLRC